MYKDAIKLVYYIENCHNFQIFSDAGTIEK